MNMEITVTLSVEPKDEPQPGALDLTTDNVVSRVQDVLADVTKHDEVCGWRVTRVGFVSAE